MYVLKRRPKRYKATPQQRRFRQALNFCGIKKGISKAELMEKMVNCIPEFFRRGDGNEETKGVRR